MNIRRLASNLWMVIFVFLIIYRPALFPVISINYILLAISVIGCFLYNQGKISLKLFVPNKEIRMFLYIMLIAALYSSVVTLIAGGKWNYGYQFIKMILYPIVYAAYIISFMKYNNYGMKQLIDCFLCASVIQSTFVVIMLLNNSFRTQIITRLINNGALGITMDRFLDFPQRSFGLGDGYWSGLSIVSGILADIAVVFSLKYSSKYYLFVPGLLLTAIVNARTGIAVFVAGLVAIIILYGRSSIIKRVGLVVLIIGLLFSLPYILNYLQKISPGTFRWVSSISDHLNNMAEQEGDATYYKLNPQYWIWPDFVQTVFGTGKSIFGNEGLANFGYSSDSGFLGVIYRGGLVLSILLYYATYILCFSKKIRTSQFKIFGIIFIFSLIIQHYKGSAFYFNEYFTLIIILVLAVYQLEAVEPKNEFRKEKIVCPKLVW